MQSHTREKWRRGQVLIESVVAITLVTVGLLSILTLVFRSIVLNLGVSERITATYLAVEGIEVIKNLIDKDIAKGKAWNSTVESGSYEVSYNDSRLTRATNRPIVLDAATGIYSYAGDTQTPFTRTITTREIDLNGDLQTDAIGVSSKVEWSRRGRMESVVLEDKLFHWR